MKAFASSNVDDPQAFNHRFAEVNGIRLHYVDDGQGPLVILLHGIPYLWYVWRRQIPALASAGYRVVAPDHRGFGQSDRPAAVEAYDSTQTAGDVVGLMATLGETTAVIVGHDLGAYTAQMTAVLRPDLVRGLVMLNSPVLARGKAKPVDALRTMQQDRTLYQVYFQQPEKPDRELACDPRRSMRSMLYSVSGSAADSERWRPFIEPGESFLDTLTDPKDLPSWLSVRALDYYVDEYARTGFTGMLNHYRNRDRTWEITSFLDGAVIRQPSMFVGGAADPALEFLRGAYDQLETYLVGLRKKLLLPGVGHDAPEEAPDKVNDLLLEFMEGLDNG